MSSWKITKTTVACLREKKRCTYGQIFNGWISQMKKYSTYGRICLSLRLINHWNNSYCCCCCQQAQPSRHRYRKVGLVSNLGIEKYDRYRTSVSKSGIGIENMGSVSNLGIENIGSVSNIGIENIGSVSKTSDRYRKHRIGIENMGSVSKNLIAIERRYRKNTIGIEKNGIGIERRYRKHRIGMEHRYRKQRIGIEHFYQKNSLIGV